MSTPVVHDVAVIGSGLVGAAVARHLAGSGLDVAIVEARADVGDGTSKANTAILHTGFDASPGTLESRLVARGYELLHAYAQQTNIPFQPLGAVLVAWTQEELETLPTLQAKAVKNGYTRSEILDATTVRALLPNLGDGVLGGLSVPDESIICTWTTNLALATDAVNRGTRLYLDHRVESVERTDDHTVLHCSAGDVQARWIINAAGLGGDVIDRLFGYDRFTLNPRRGELLVYDKLARPLVDKIVLPVPSKLGKGVLVSPTVFGNVMVGPTAEELEDRTDTSTSPDGFDFLLGKCAKLVPALMDEEVTASYAGLRAASSYPDYLIELDAEQRYVVAGGIRSTGLTSGMAIAEHIAGLLAEAGVDVTERADLPAPPLMPRIGEAQVRPYADADRIEQDCEYGHVVCFCERVTAGEIRDTFTSPIPPATLEGLRRRTRAMNGRCQGFFCGAEVSRRFACHQADVSAGDSAAADALVSATATTTGPAATDKDNR